MIDYVGWLGEAIISIFNLFMSLGKFMSILITFLPDRISLIVSPFLILYISLIVYKVLK